MISAIADQVDATPIKHIARQPGVKEVYRTIIHFHDFRAANTVMTLTRRGQYEVILAVVYQNLFNHKPIKRVVTLEDYAAFTKTVRQAGFDKLTDPDTLPYDADICLMERAAGSFIKSVVFPMNQIDSPYVALQQAVKTYLPEAMRELER